MVEVALEIGPKKKVFATAVGWPGWSRSGADEEQALAALAAYAPRYAPVVARAGLALPEVTGAGDLVVVERVAGDGTTDFGAPGKVTGHDTTPLPAGEAARRTDLLEAAWALFDDVVATAPVVLRKGPRGGGRDRDQIVAHVRNAQRADAGKVGVRQQVAEDASAAERQRAETELRAALADLLRQPSDGQPLRPKGWPARCAAARIAWHVLDHAWEIQDKSEPPVGGG